MKAARDDDVELRGELRQPARLLKPHRTAKARIELERVGCVEIALELRDERRGGFHERQRSRPRPQRRRVAAPRRVAGHPFGVLALRSERQRREHFRRQHLDEGLGRERMTCDPVGELARMPPARANLRRAADRDPDALLAVGAAVCRARAAIHRTHLARQRAGGQL